MWSPGRSHGRSPEEAPEGARGIIFACQLVHSSPLLHSFHILLLQSVEDPASIQADRINGLFNHFNVVAALMLLLVLVLTTWFCIRFRRPADDNGEGSPVEGNRIMEVLMIGVPTLLLAWFFYEAFTVSQDVLPSVASTRKPDVVITGHQFWWEANYPGKKVSTANEVHLPVGSELLIELRSADVVHDWWVPQLGNKMDLVPGRINNIWLNIRKPGDYIGACSEFCGEQHAWMRIRVVAQSREDFDRWLDSNAVAAAAPADELARKGKTLFETRSCANCHRVEGTPASGTAGPDLTHLASRSTLLTGLLTMSERNLNDWIDHPQQIKHGAYMPAFMFPRDSVTALAHYLGQLK